MLSNDVILSIRDLLAEGRLSKRKIAQKTGVSFDTVNQVALGNRILTQPRKGTEFVFLTDAVRCPTCGDFIQIVPCIACRARKNKDIPRLPDQDEIPIGIELYGDELTRYQGVRKDAQEQVESGRRKPLDGLLDR